jgi:transglutaminase-like putative cysteine protease
LARRGLGGGSALCLAGAFVFAAAAPALGIGTRHWEVTFALRVTSDNNHKVGLRLALPQSTIDQRVSDLEVDDRALDAVITPDGNAPHVRFHGKIKGSRRVAVTYRIERDRRLDVVPPVHPVEAPDAAILPYVRATPLLQSRSILVREFLETHVTPALRDANGDLMLAIFNATRTSIEHDSKGKTLVLDVVRSRRAQRIGIERAFTTFLRCARIPARLVEGIDLKKKTKRKRVFWTEVWAAGRWWPVSASDGWVGRLPTSHVALSRDGARVLAAEGTVEASYQVETLSLDPAAPKTRKGKAR